MGKMSFYEEKHINGNRHQLVKLATEAWLELVENGFADARYVGFENTDSVLYAMDTKANVVAGFIVYSIDEVSKRAYVQIGYVHPDYREKGLYRNLLRYFDNILRDQHIQVVESIVSADNEPMNSTAAKRKVIGQLTRKDVQ